MKLIGQQSRSRSREGSAVIVVLLLLAILFMYLNANVRSLHYLGRELRLIESKQVQRVQASHPSKTTTNTVAVPWTASPPSTNR